MLRILIVDDQKTICEALRTVLASETDFEVIAVAYNGETALEYVKKLSPDLMLVDLEMPGLNGLDLTKLISRHHPQVKVIVLSMHDEDTLIQKSLQVGASGYLLKNTPPEDLKESIRFVSRGYTQFSPGLLNKVVPLIEEYSPEDDPLSNTNDLFTKTERFSIFKSQKSHSERKNWYSYLPFWLFGNGVIWGLTALYFVLQSPTYTSQWSISLQEDRNLNEVDVADANLGNVSITKPNFSSSVKSLRKYKSLYAESELLAISASKLGLSLQEFGSPDITALDSTNTLKLSIQGNSPEEAQSKAIALQIAFDRKIGQLRDNLTREPDSKVRIRVTNSQQELQNARQKLADYQTVIRPRLCDRSNNLYSDLVMLRERRDSIRAQLESTNSEVRRLSISLGISPQIAQDLDILHSDSAFQRYLSRYDLANRELITLESRFQAANPLVIQKKEEISIARDGLIQQGKNLLGSNFSLDLIGQLTLKSRNNSFPSNLLKEIVSLRSQADVLSLEYNDLNRQVQELETQLKIQTDKQSTLKQLQQEVVLAEQKYTADLAQWESQKNDLSNYYPEMEVVSQPSLNQKPSYPHSQVVYLSAFATSTCLTLLIVYLWLSSSQKSPKTNPNDFTKAFSSETS